MTVTYQHLGIFGDWAAVANRAHPLTPLAPPGRDTQRKVCEVLNFSVADEAPLGPRTERRWEREGVAGEQVSWSVGYGPRTSAWVLRPSTVTTPLPGVVALHDHGGFKFYGKEKIADGPDELAPSMLKNRKNLYGGRAFANALAREGFTVLVHDTFLWGSRRFPLESMPESIRQIGRTYRAWGLEKTSGDETIDLYNACASQHELLIEKYCALLGTTLAGVVSYEDRVAANYLASRPDVLAERLGCVGLSGGGCRAALLQATCDRISASVIAGMMSTYAPLLDHNVVSHTWMFFPAGWARYGDWPDLAACRAPSPLMVQYNLDDALFTNEGMRAAHERILSHYAGAGALENYTGEFYPGPHKFDLPMQASAFQWLKRYLFT